MVWSPWLARSARDSGKERQDHPCVALLETSVRARKASTSPCLRAPVSAVFMGGQLRFLVLYIYGIIYLGCWGIPETSCQRV